MSPAPWLRPWAAIPHTDWTLTVQQDIDREGFDWSDLG